MIQLNPDYLLFEMPDGNAVPCSAETVTVELIGEAVESLDPDIVKNAAAAVLHYFQHEEKKQTVSVNEFSNALERVLRGFGFEVVSNVPGPSIKTVRADLGEISEENGQPCEILLFQRLRAEIHRQVEGAPVRVCFSGLRPCVKRILGLRRWSPRCQGLSDQIVNYVRDCLSREKRHNRCAVVIS